MDASLLCKSFFTIGTAVNIGGVLVPSFRGQIMNYGSRAAQTQRTEEKTKTPESKPDSILDGVASFRVSHAWFTHFYVVSVLSSIFWAVQLLTHGTAFNFLASHQISSTTGMTVNQVALVWCFMTLQGIRRLYESIVLAKPSQSKMWVGIWLGGIAYYIFIGISIWIEGTCE
jgi:3-oxo-5-alpha-steroid 4-dehydrogenase 3